VTTITFCEDKYLQVFGDRIPNPSCGLRISLVKIVGDVVEVFYRAA
jgi:hypothetical protein